MNACDEQPFAAAMRMGKKSHMLLLNWFTSVVSGLKALFRKEQSNHELDLELSQFLDASAAHHEDCGMSPVEARRAALLEMGSTASVRQ